jgi:hypothetical protein
MKTWIALVIVCFVFYGFICSSGFQPPPGKKASKIDEGLVIYFPFNGNANDAGKNNYHGTVKRAQPCDDRNGNKNSAYSFNGSDNYIQVDDVKELHEIQKLTVAAWIFPKSYEIEGYTAWISKPLNENYSQFRIGFGREPDKLWGMTIYDTTWNEYCANSYIPLNQWSFVAYTVDCENGTAKAYLNGKEVGSWTNVKKIPASSSSLFIGYQPDDRSMFDGMIDEVRIYHRVLQAKDIFTLFTSK